MKCKLIIFPLLLFFLSSCGLTEAELSAPPSPSPEPSAVPAEESVREPIERTEATPMPNPDDGMLHLSMRSPVTLNPLLNTDPTVDAILKLIYEPLVVLDETLKPVGNLVSYRFSSDYTSANLTIRDDAIWSDGTPVTATDVIYSIDTIREAPEDSIYKRRVANIAKCEEISNKLVKITFGEVYGGSPYSLMFPLIPAHNAEAEDALPIGDGLYIMESFTENDGLTLIKSPYTFRAQAEIDKINVLFLPDKETELYAFDQGIIDALSMEISEWMKHHSVKLINYGEFPAMYFDFIGFNYDHPLVSQAEFREAVACSFDMDEAVADIYLDHALRAVAPINPASWVAAEVRGSAYDAGKAERLFKTASQNAERLLDAAEAENAEEENAEEGEVAPSVYDTSSVRILVNEENDERVKIAARLDEAMTAAGMPARVESLPFEEFSARLAAGDFEIVVGNYSFDVVPDLRFAFHSESVTEREEETDGKPEDGEAEETVTAVPGNFMRYSDPRMDELLDSAAAAFSEAEYQAALYELQEFFAAERPVIGLAFRKSAVIVDARISGDLIPTADNAFANINEWKLEEVTEQ